MQKGSKFDYPIRPKYSQNNRALGGMKTAIFIANVNSKITPKSFHDLLFIIFNYSVRRFHILIELLTVFDIEVILKNNRSPNYDLIDLCNGLYSNERGFVASIFYLETIHSLITH